MIGELSGTGLQPFPFNAFDSPLGEKSRQSNGVGCSLSLVAG